MPDDLKQEVENLSGKDKSKERLLQQEIIYNTLSRHNLIGYANPELPFRIEKKR